MLVICLKLTITHGADYYKVVHEATFEAAMEEDAGTLETLETLADPMDPMDRTLQALKKGHSTPCTQTVPAGPFGT